MIRASHQGFTLVELSIVLVIIGLVIGGVLVGKDLVYASQVRATIRVYQDYDTATNTFKLKYQCLPGDCGNATTYSLTTNGNGNDQINYDNSESFVYWTHLNQAGLADANPPFYLPRYVKKYEAPDYCYNTVNGWMVYYMPELNWFGGYQYAKTISPLHAFSLMSVHYNCWSDIITPQTAYDIDSKIDDGYPATGIVRSGISQTTARNATGTDYNTGLHGSCLNTSVSPVRYNLSNTDFGCTLFLKASF